MKWVDQWVDALLGPGPSLRGGVTDEAAIAYLDPFDNLDRTQKLPDLLLKPESIDQTITMSKILLETPGIGTVIIDSFFWLPGTTKEFEQAIRAIMRIAKKAQKQIYFLGPSNKMQDVVLGHVAHNNLISFKSNANHTTLVRT